ncbi:hypothetical protein EMA8858_01512 [Emticicia aquatica]|jgi:hypothetical protein|uniref:Uncharacterized protein n=1 Tax=Emticicia aquatica TaxID=1681835 RepID=A0ABN8ETV2_9BACT|nr:DUF2934 domain-containing protein [Emticicia aquatica]CAH0995391.1 hypothetical protein EMA8858_01512 [Emticicia aquatica]
MPYEITLCAGGDCPIKQYCYRHTAEILGRQDFFGSVPFDYTTKKCYYFLKNEAYFEQIRKNAYKIWENNGKPDNSSVSHWQLAEEVFFLSL